MSFPQRETIVLVSAIVGANLFGILTYSKAATSNGLCDGFWSKPTDSQSSAPRTDIPYWQNNPWAAAAPRAATAPTASPASPATRTQSPTPVPGTSTPISGAIAPLPPGFTTEDEYQANRRANALRMEGN